MKDIVIFGSGDTADQAFFYFTVVAGRTVSCFTVDSDFIREDTFAGQPLVPFESLDDRYPPDRYEMFVAISGRNLNRDRAAKFAEARSRGYTLASFVHPSAILSNNRVGQNCFFLEHANVQPFATLGDDVFLLQKTHIGHHSRLGSHLFLSGYAAVSGRTTVGDYCFIAARSTVNSDLTLGEGTLLTLHAALTESTDPWSVYHGAPARKRKVPSYRYKYL